jgi:hypothetical protein
VVAILVLVLTLCLATLAILDAAFARTNLATTQKHAAAVEQTYTNENAAQEMLAALDAALSQAAQNGEGSEGFVGVNSSASAVPEAQPSGAAETGAGIRDAEELASDTFAMENVITGALDAFSPEGTTFTYSLNGADSAAETGAAGSTGTHALTAHFETQTGATLDVACTFDTSAPGAGGYQITQWKCGANWENTNHSRALWAGPATTQEE